MWLIFHCGLTHDTLLCFRSSPNFPVTIRKRKYPFVIFDYLHIRKNDLPGRFPLLNCIYETGRSSSFWKKSWKSVKYRKVLREFHSIIYDCTYFTVRTESLTKTKVKNNYTDERERHRAREKYEKWCGGDKKYGKDSRSRRVNENTEEYLIEKRTGNNDEENKESRVEKNEENETEINVGSELFLERKDKTNKNETMEIELNERRTEIETSFTIHNVF